ncbi:VWA domain-containing protein [Aliishimia ponticola]|uniref:VWA domain-containing protein n=1 Tax=Aliishimia ponticola TaxID=2499833 RepID=A0A4S4NIS6_9RHOB|nr:VWA domain-containing protein [Aliishimia ponticola]THH38805.1 VWA domain-containing protein [Aliishimia ponticola]
MSVSLPFNLVDGAGFRWDIQRDGQIGDGTLDAFDGGMDNVDQPTVGQADLELFGRQLVLRAGAAVSDPFISLERRIYVPDDAGWARFIDTVTNTGTQATTYTLRLSTNFGSDGASQIIATSSGDQVLDTADSYFINDDTAPEAGDPQVAIAFGDGTRAPDVAGYPISDRADLIFTFDLQPGQSASVMTFAAQSYAPGTLQALAEALAGPLDEDMALGISATLAASILNYHVAGYNEQTTYFGNEGADTLVGSARNEWFLADAGDDTILGQAGADRVDSGVGDDVVLGGDGHDDLRGGGGNDVLQGEAGNDVMDGDAGWGQSRVATADLPGAGQSLALTLTATPATRASETLVDGVITTGAGAAGTNLVIAVDLSGSMNTVFDGAAGLGDLSGDGAPDQMIDLLHAGLAGFIDTMITTGHAGQDVVILGYADTAEVLFDGALGAGASGALSGQIPNGASDYEAALQAAVTAFGTMGAGQNRLVFLSDGVATAGGTYLDTAETLRSGPIGADIQTLALGPLAGVYELDLLDDGVPNNSVGSIGSAADLTSALTAPTLSAAPMDRVEILVNGTLQTVLPASDLEQTPLGLRFQVEAAGLVEDEADDVTARLIAADGAATQVEVMLTLDDEDDQTGDDVLLGGEGDDALEGSGGHDRLIGAAGNDSLYGGAGQDALTGGAGDDWLLGGAGDDILHGGAGADWLIGGDGSDTVSYAGSIAPVIVDLAAQTVFGGDATGDVIAQVENAEGTSQNDNLSGSEADNILRGGLGDDLIDGQAGFDIADYSDVPGGIYVALNLPEGEQDTLSGGIDYLTGIEGLIGSQFDDYLIGNSGYNVLSGGAGADVLKSKGGNDRLYGGGGDDRLIGDAGEERLIGDAGRDEVYGNAGNDLIYGGAGDDYLYGGRDMDVMYGQGGADVMRGNIGGDFMDGGRGADDLRGGGSGDTIFGGSGDDFIMGENGADVLSGGSGRDVLIGGAGEDIFIFDPLCAFDSVRDFEVGVDTLDVSAFHLAGFAALQEIAVDRSSGLRIDFGDGDVAFLEDMALADLSAADVIL